MSQLTQRENTLKVYAGEMPDWVPVAEKAYALCMPFAVLGGGGPGQPAPEPGTIIYNLLKTPHMIPPDPNIGPMPIPGDPQVPDITRWREYLEFPFPDVSTLDWSTDIEMAKGIDRDNLLVQALVGGVAFSGAPYNSMVDILGHEGASIAMLDEDEKAFWHELLTYQTDLEIALIDRLVDIYQPDIICSCDDLANAHGPFMSPATYAEMIRPYQERIIKRIIEAGCIAEVHCCGKADGFVDDWVEMGVKAWNPAQIFNDLEGIKAKYGRQFVISGGYDSQGKINVKGASEEEVRASIRDSFRKYAPGGGYIFGTSGMALAHDLGEEHMNWILDEAEKCSKEAY
ncbi:MAG: hypothetical protein LBU61_03995 [Coriobacteriales bacterium]|jgi:hypothetical protein|nr:hypothetical protein [Coriobacteriales bacterium]